MYSCVWPTDATYAFISHNVHLLQKNYNMYSIGIYSSRRYSLHILHDIYHVVYIIYMLTLYIYHVIYIIYCYIHIYIYI